MTEGICYDGYGRVEKPHALKSGECKNCGHSAEIHSFNGCLWGPVPEDVCYCEEFEP